MRIPKSRWLSAGVLAGVVFLCVGAGSARYAWKTVTVYDGGQRQVIGGFAAKNLGQFLADHGVQVTSQDRVSPPLTSRVASGMTVRIEHPKQVTLVTGLAKQRFQTFAPTVKDFLEQQGIPTGDTQAVSEPLSAPLTDGEELDIVEETSRTSVQTRTIQFQTIRRSTDALYRGQQRVVTRGVEGLQRIRTTEVLRNGKLVRRTVTRTTVRQPQDRVIEVGTRPHSYGLSARSIGSLVIERQLTVLATAYPAGGRTASGTPAQPGEIAVDPTVIPLGTKWYIPGIGIVRAEDTGSAIRGNRIDICMATLGQADSWGLRTVTIYQVR
ncbi:MAG: G5 domain-containing protein [Alicyclobacillus sp.]|nr:G5 domain-containing protein [Alicyclobacillus sp.]